MANSLLTIDMINREAVRLFTNSNAVLMQVDRQYDDQFARTGAKIGSTLRIRLPNDYTVRTGQVASVQATNEVNTTLTLATQKGVDMSFTSADLALSLDDFSERILAPAVNNLAGAVASDVMSGVEGFSNLVFKGSTLTASPDASTWLQAGAQLDLLSAPRDRRKILLDPLTQARTVSSLSGLFNPQIKVSDQFTTGEMARNTLGFDWYMDQTVIKHTNGTFSAGGTVNGANQTGTSITVNAITGTLKKGDIVTFAGVDAVNRVTKQTTGQLAQFVVTSDVATGATSIPIYPALTPPSGGNSVQYQTVTASPANAAAMTLIGGASTTYRKNVVFRPEALTLATADLELPRKGVVEAAREQYDGISLRMISAYDVTNDAFITRLDILYGWATVRGEWGCAVGDIL